MYPRIEVYRLCSLRPEVQEGQPALLSRRIRVLPREGVLHRRRQTWTLEVLKQRGGRELSPPQVIRVCREDPPQNILQYQAWVEAAGACPLAHSLKSGGGEGIKADAVAAPNDS